MRRALRHLQRVPGIFRASAQFLGSHAPGRSFARCGALGTQNVKRSLLVASSVLLAVVALGAAYARFSSASAEAAPAVPPIAAAPATSVASALSAPSAARSPEQERLEQRRVLYETVDSLVHAADFERARKLLDEDQARYGEDSAPEWRDLETSYRLIADCLEQPHSAKSRMRAQAFVQVTEARVLVPKVLAACQSAR